MLSESNRNKCGAHDKNEKIVCCCCCFLERDDGMVRTRKTRDEYLQSNYRWRGSETRWSKETFSL